ncbi:hypothetical protein ABPG72_016849 [Tetrahymena utriculariae]
MCLYKSQSPTTIIGDIDDMFFMNKKFNTVLGEQMIQNILKFKQFYLYAAFWILSAFTALEIYIYIYRKCLDSKTRQKIFSQVYPEQQINQQQKDQEQEEQAYIQALPKIQSLDEDQKPGESSHTPPQTNSNIPNQLLYNNPFTLFPEEIKSAQSSKRTQNVFYARRKRTKLLQQSVQQKIPESSLNSIPPNGKGDNNLYFQIAKYLSLR